MLNTSKYAGLTSGYRRWIMLLQYLLEDYLVLLLLGGDDNIHIKITKNLGISDSPVFLNLFSVMAHFS